MVTKENACTILVGNQEGKIPLRKHRCSWEDNVKMGLNGKINVAVWLPLSFLRMNSLWHLGTR
jgi:hypothetical protein